MCRNRQIIILYRFLQIEKTGMPGHDCRPVCRSLDLLCPETAALGLGCLAGPVAGYSDMLCRTFAALIIDAVYRLASYIQLLFRRLKQIGKSAALVFIEAAAAGFIGFLRRLTVYHDLVLAAAVICIVHTAGYVTV